MKYLETDHIRFNDEKNKVIILNQAELPNHEEYLEIDTAEDMYDAIYELQVRGAPAIGIFAGYAMACLAKKIKSENRNEFLIEFGKMKNYLNSSRPTAVNLSWALNRMEQTVIRNERKTIPEILVLLEEEAIKIHEEDIEMCKLISTYGLSLLKDGDGILTHCNAGPLATSRYGTALGPILLGHEEEMYFKVFADETRPLLQGARLTSYELERAGVDVTLICDNMASLVMKTGWIQA